MLILMSFSLKPLYIFAMKLGILGGLDYLHLSQQSRSSERSNDCSLHNRNNHCHHFHGHSMLPLLGHYHNITICQAISPENFGHSGKNTFKMKSKWHPAQTAHPLSVTCTNMNELGE